MQGDQSSALAVLDELVALNPDRGTNYLLRASIERNSQRKLEAIQKAIEIDKYLPQAYFDLAQWHILAASYTYGDVALAHRRTALSNLQTCKDLNPGKSNPAWSALIDVAGRIHLYDKAEKYKQQDEIIAELEKQGPESYYCLEIKIGLAKEREDKSKLDKLLEILKSIEKKRGLESATWAVGLQFVVMESQYDVDGIIGLVDRCEHAEILRQDTDLACKAASALRNIVGDEEKSQKILCEGLRLWDFNSSIFTSLFNQYVDLRKVADARQIYEIWGGKIVEQYRQRMLAELYEAEGEYTKAIQVLTNLAQQTGRPDNTTHAYLLNKAEKFSEAEKLTRSILEGCNFSTEAYSEIVKYELARKRSGKKPDVNRLQNLLRTPINKKAVAAAYALLGRKVEMLDALKAAYHEDKTFRYEYLRWPVFYEYWNEADVRHMLGLKN